MLNNNSPTALPWYALRIRSNQEKVVSSILETKGFERYLPLYRAKRRWSDRVKELELPLFPGYLFCRLDMNDAAVPVITTPGVIAITGTGKIPVPIPEEEIEAVRTVIRSGLAVMPWPGLTAGSRVLIEHGPLMGVEGIAVDVEDQCRLVVSIHLLRRSLSVEIDRSWARPIGKTVQRENASLSPMSRNYSVAIHAQRS